MSGPGAVVQEGPRRLSRQEFPLPEVGPEDALLRVEACGICGSDYEQYAGALPAPVPVIPGHEPAGLIEEVGEAPAERSVLFTPVGAGFRWGLDLPGTRPGDTVVVLGPGQRGLASVIACREAGAGCIIVTGLARDEAKLALASRFGAHHVINVEAEDAAGRVREITDGAMADVVVDVTSYAVEAVTQAFDLARRGGTVVLAGTKGAKPVPDFLSGRVVVKELRVLGALGVDSSAYEAAIRLIESGRYPPAARPP